MVTPSRGCLQCRRQHIKCDEGHPTCLHCLRRGITCSGPVAGVLFFDETEKVKRKHPHRHKKPPSGSTLSFEFVTAVDDQSADGAPLQVGVVAPFEAHKRLYASQFRLPPVQPSRADMFERMFASHLTSSFAKWALDPAMEFDQNWMSDICKPPVSHSLPSVELAGRAVSMAFYSALTKDPSIEKASCEYYARALFVQRSYIQAGMINDPKRVSDTIFACLMMMYFEVVFCTTPGGWADHAAAAISLLDIIGPEVCQTGNLNLVFRHFRLAAVYLSVDTKTPSTLAQEKWRTIPFQIHSKFPLDELVDLLLCIPDYQVAVDDILAHPDGSFMVDREEDINNVRGALFQLLVGLDRWNEANNAPGHVSPQESGMNQSTKGQENRIVGSVVSLYHSARIVIHCLLLALSTPNTEEGTFHQQMIIDQCQEVLTLGVEELKTSFGDLGCLYMIFPVKVVGVFSPSPEQRSLATRILVHWTKHKAIGGIFNFAISWVEAGAENNIQLLDHNLKWEI